MTKDNRSPPWGTLPAMTSAGGRRRSAPPLDVTNPATWPALLTVDEAALILRTPPETVRHWLREGDLPSLRFGRLWRVPRSALQDPSSLHPPQESKCPPPADDATAKEQQQP